MDSDQESQLSDAASQRSGRTGHAKTTAKTAKTQPKKPAKSKTNIGDEEGNNLKSLQFILQYKFTQS